MRQKALRLPARQGVPDYRILRRIASRDFPTKQFGTYLVETEPGIQAVVYRLSEQDLFSRPPADPRRAVLYVSHRSADAELRDEPFVREIFHQEPNAAFYSCDVRGIGESQPNTTGQNAFQNPYGSHYFYAIQAVMLDRPLVGQRTFDVLKREASFASVSDARESCDTQMPPPAPTLAVVSTAELFWTVLLVNVASPLAGAVKLKIAMPAPLPFVVLQYQGPRWSA